ncbi:universal stress protein [Pedobacter sp. Du54]|uniref:universal stress protein n=1 Tax=Pedobacter anseongensis TaxID=3133439 RepID=UPI0030A9D051
MEKILIPTDFSKCAAIAIDFAMQSAKIDAIELSLVHVMELYPAIYGDPSGFAASYPLIYREDMEKQLKDLKDQLMRKGSLHISATIYEGPISSGIVQAQKDQHADLILMGTNGASGLQEKLFGSGTGAVIGSANVPVLAIPCKYKWKRPRKIVLATNGFEKQPAVIEYILNFIRFYKAEFHIVVFTNDKKDKALTLVEHQYQLNSYQEKIKSQYGIDAVTNHIHGLDLEASLDEYIRKEQIDVLAMVTHKRKLFEGIFNPSTTRRVSYHTTVPLLAIPSTIKMH